MPFYRFKNYEFIYQNENIFENVFFSNRGTNAPVLYIILELLNPADHHLNSVDTHVVHYFKDNMQSVCVYPLHIPMTKESKVTTDASPPLETQGKNKNANSDHLPHGDLFELSV